MKNISINKIFISLAAALFFTGCQAQADVLANKVPTDTIGSQASPATGTVSMRIENFSFKPNTVFVKKGTTIEVTNGDLAVHTLTANDGTFDTGDLNHLQYGSLVMDKVGTFAYHCSRHPNMTGTITVIE